MSFRLQSARSRRPVTFECDTVRDIRPDEDIHYKPELEYPSCLVCGLDMVIGEVWTDDQGLWQRSAKRCI